MLRAYVEEDSASGTTVHFSHEANMTAAAPSRCVAAGAGSRAFFCGVRQGKARFGGVPEDWHIVAQWKGEGAGEFMGRQVYGYDAGGAVSFHWTYRIDNRTLVYAA
jgi:hypothetical protein